MHKRKMNYDKYGISRNRYRELYYFCKQYAEWKSRVREIDSGVQPYAKKGDIVKDPTGDLATERAMLTKKIELLEATAKEACSEFWEELIWNASGDTSYSCLNARYRVPLSESAFYERRRYFFYLLSKRKM